MATKKATKPEPKLSPVERTLAELKKHGYKTESWEDTDKELIYFRMEKDGSPRLLAYSPEAVADADFPKTLVTILQR